MKTHRTLSWPRFSYLPWIFALFNFISCQQENPCEGITCQNGGACINGTCECPNGFTGKFCETQITGSVIFWANQDLGCGTVTVSAGNQTATITSFLSTGTPTCGVSGFATLILPIGTYSYTATCSGVSSWSGTVTISANNCSTIKIDPQKGTISGKVIGQGGVAIPSPIISLLKNSTIVKQATGNSLGEFTLTDITLGGYTLKATATGFEDGVKSVELTSSASTNNVIELIAKKGTISGKVVDPFNSGLRNANLTLLSNGTIVKQQTGTGTGEFNLTDVSYGTYQLKGVVTGFDETIINVTLSGPTSINNLITLQPQSLPSGGLRRATVNSFSNTSANFDLDLFIVDKSGVAVAGLSQSNFSIPTFTGSSSGTTFSFSIQGSTMVAAGPTGPYSAELLMDQSGSITSTDPNDARIQASKIFMGALGPGDNVHLSAFAGSGRLISYEVTSWGNGFTPDGASYFSVLDQLATLEGGGTPLYKATHTMLDYTSKNAPNNNKALLVFTDGEDTDGGRTIDDIAALSGSTGVKVFTIGLGSGVNRPALGEIAARCNGSFFVATDARQLVSMYKSLGNLLNGTAPLYRVSFRVDTSSPAFPGWFSTTLKVSTSVGDVSIPIYVSPGN